jgi:colicin import membrane protein
VSINWDRATHPDLIEEEAAAREKAEETPPERPARGRRGRARAEAPTPVEASAPEASPSEPQAEAKESESNGAPEWLSQVREATDPPSALAAILKNTPLEELQKHPQIAGWIGDMAQKRARALALQQAQEEEARQKADAWQRGDYYRLGELSATEQEARALQAQQQQASAPFMQSIEEFQRTLPEEAQRAIQGKSYNSVAEYMQAAVEAAASHRLEAAVQAEVKKREPALRKAELSATVGAEQSPERDGGPPPGTREITDAEIGSMSLQEYERYFDEHGKPKGGVQVRYTRAIDVTRR